MLGWEHVRFGRAAYFLIWLLVPAFLLLSIACPWKRAYPWDGAGQIPGRGPSPALRRVAPLSAATPESG